MLLCIQGLDPGDADKLISQRGSVGNADTGSIGWVADALGQKAIGIGNQITGKSTRYSADILAVSGNGRAFKRVRIVVDMGSTTGATPKIIYRRDLTDRGWPMDPQILASLRNGGGPGNVGGPVGAIGSMGGFGR